MQEAMHVCVAGQQGLYRKSLFLPFYFAVNLKLLSKKLSLWKNKVVEDNGQLKL